MGVGNILPREGSRLRAIYDELMENKGFPIQGGFTNRDKNCVEQLQNFYGLDIRIFRHGKGRGKGSTSVWILAGEWFGKTYVDYIADRINAK
jgi:hypothetical protein